MSKEHSHTPSRRRHSVPLRGAIRVDMQHSIMESSVRHPQAVGVSQNVDMPTGLRLDLRPSRKERPSSTHSLIVVGVVLIVVTLVRQQSQRPNRVQTTVLSNEVLRLGTRRKLLVLGPLAAEDGLVVGSVPVRVDARLAPVGHGVELGGLVASGLLVVLRGRRPAGDERDGVFFCFEGPDCLSQRLVS
jgi:hypothetical protein